MTREQDFERQLAEWLAEGPNTAPDEVIDRALEQTDGRRQWRGAWRLQALPFLSRDRSFSVDRMARVGALTTMVAGILIASAVVTTPFLGGGAGTSSPSPSPSPSLSLAPAPAMVGALPRAVAGTAVTEIISETPGEPVVLAIDLGSDDPRIEGHATQELIVLLDEAGAQRLSGTMRLQNRWGTWKGPVDIVRYPTGEEYEYASLKGSGAYEGYTYLHTIRHTTAEAERSVQGAIWPDEPPAPPDPQLLP